MWVAVRELSFVETWENAWSSIMYMPTTVRQIFLMVFQLVMIPIIAGVPSINAVPLITATTAPCFATIGAGRALPVRLGVQLVLFDLPVCQGHFTIIDPAFLVFFDLCAGSQEGDSQRRK